MNRTQRRPQCKSRNISLSLSDVTCPTRWTCFLCNNMATPAACVAISDVYKTCPPSKTQRPRALRVSLNKITSQSTLCNSAASSAKRSCECIRAFLEKTLYNKFWEHASVGLLSSKLVGAPRICDCETLCLGRSCPYPHAAAPAALLFPKYQRSTHYFSEGERKKFARLHDSHISYVFLNWRQGARMLGWTVARIVHSLQVVKQAKSSAYGPGLRFPVLNFFLTCAIMRKCVSFFQFYDFVVVKRSHCFSKCMTSLGHNILWNGRAKHGFCLRIAWNDAKSLRFNVLLVTIFSEPPSR